MYAVLSCYICGNLLCSIENEYKCPPLKGKGCGGVLSACLSPYCELGRRFLRQEWSHYELRGLAKASRQTELSSRSL